LSAITIPRASDSQSLDAAAIERVGHISSRRDEDLQVVRKDDRSDKVSALLIGDRSIELKKDFVLRHSTLDETMCRRHLRFAHSVLERSPYLTKNDKKHGLTKAEKKKQLVRAVWMECLVCEECGRRFRTVEQRAFGLPVTFELSQTIEKGSRGVTAIFRSLSDPLYCLANRLDPDSEALKRSTPDPRPKVLQEPKFADGLRPESIDYYKEAICYL